MIRDTVTGHKALAARLGVTSRTVQYWKSEGVLNNAILSEFRRTIIYDVEKVYECLNHRKVKPGRRNTI